MYSWFGERMSVDIRIVGEIENEIMSKVRKLVYLTLSYRRE